MGLRALLPGLRPHSHPSAAEFVVAVQTRRELLPGRRSTGSEVTIEVDDLTAALERVEELSGRIVMERSTIPGLGDLAFVADPSDNVLGVIQYTS